MILYDSYLYMMSDATINLEDFLNNRRKCTIQYGDQQRVFQEPSIEELLAIKGQSDANNVAHSMIIEGDPKEFDKITNKLSIESKSEIYRKILTQLGLGWRLQNT